MNGITGMLVCVLEREREKVGGVGEGDGGDGGCRGKEPLQVDDDQLAEMQATHGTDNHSNID